MTDTTTDRTTVRSPLLPPDWPDRVAGLLARSAVPVDRPAQPVVCPFDDTVIAEVPFGTPDDVAAAVAAARAAQPSWAARPLAERTRVALRLHDLLLARQSGLLDLVQLETGKARVGAFEELADAAMTARYYGRSARRHLRPRRAQGAIPLLTRTEVQHDPVGVVGVISPWNYPLTLAVSDAIAALVAGNAVVIKPDARTPLTALAVARVLDDAGLPPGLFAVVPGRGAELGTPLIDAVDFLMFTGSTATGRRVAEQCGRRLIGCSAELGGKNPMLVLADADLDRAVEGAVTACFANSGQLCVSIERLYVVDAVYDAFVPALVERVRAMRLGVGLDWAVDMGSLAGPDQLAVVTRHVEDAVARGARVLAGGRARPELGPCVYEPTLLADVPDDAEVARAETFGPVVSVYRVRDDAEAVARANDTEYGLNASVWASPGHGREVASRLRAGTVNVNDGYSAAWASHDAPLGGWQASGLGRRHGAEGIHKYTEARTVALQHGLPRVPSPLAPIPGLDRATWAGWMTGAVRLMRWLPGRD